MKAKKLKKKNKSKNKKIYPLEDNGVSVLACANYSWKPKNVINLDFRSS